MRKKPAGIVSRFSDHLSNRPTKRLPLSRETLRILTSEELSHAIGAGEEGLPCPTPTFTIPSDI